MVDLHGHRVSPATAFLRAAELSTDDARRVGRLAAAAQAAWAAGQPSRSREIIEQVLPRATGQTRVRVLHLSGVIEARAGSLQEACTRLLQGAGEGRDPPLKLEMLLEAAEAASLYGDYARSIEIAAHAAPVPAVSPRDKLIVALLGGFTKALAGEHEQAQSLLEEHWGSRAPSTSRPP